MANFLVDHEYTLDITPSARPQLVHVSEYDVGRRFTFTITQGGEEFIGLTSSVGDVTVEGTIGSYAFSEPASIENGKIVFQLTESMTAHAGKAWTKIKFANADAPISTCAFFLVVDRAGVEADTVIGASGFEEQIQDAVDDYLDGHQPFFTLPEGGEAGQALLSDGEDGAFWGEAQSGGGISQTAINLLDTILKNAIYKTEQTSNIIALKTALESGGGSTTFYSVTNNLTNATTSNNASRVSEGSNYVATITLEPSAVLQSVNITMGGNDITASAYSDGNIIIENVSGNIVITVSASVPTLDSVAYGNVTYRDIFMSGNGLSGFDFENGVPTNVRVNAGTPTVSEDDCFSQSHSLKCFGTSSQQYLVSQNANVTSGKPFYMAYKVRCDRYVRGGIGLQISAGTYNAPFVSSVTDGWVTVSSITTFNNTQFSGFYFGSFSNANLDGYLDDLVVVPIDQVFGDDVEISKETMDSLYEVYANLRKAGES